MSLTDHDTVQPCRVIPFIRPEENEDKLTTSSIAAVIAVTVLHYEGESPERRLLEIIEASGEAEVLDVIDVLDQFEYFENSNSFLSSSVNDNRKILFTSL